MYLVTDVNKTCIRHSLPINRLEKPTQNGTNYYEICVHTNIIIQQMKDALFLSI